MKVAVIGAGIIGSCLAYRLVERGADVLLLESGDLAQGASSGSVAWLNASTESPGPYFDLRRAGMAAHQALAGDFGTAPWLHQTGHLLWTDGQDTPHLQSRVDTLNAHGYQIEMRPAHVVAEKLEPNVSFPSTNHPVVYSAEEGWVDTPLLIHNLVRRAAELGAQVYRHSSVDRIDVADSSVSGVGCADGRHWEVDAVVNAAGSAAGEVGSLIGRPLPMRCSPGLVIRLHCPDLPVRTVMHAPHVVIRPERHGQILIHSKSGDALLRLPLVEDNAEAIDTVTSLATIIVPQLADSHGSEAQIALRPIPEDGKPSLGELSEVSGYYEAVAHSGVTLAPVIADLLAAEITTAGSHKELTQFRPDRFDRRQRPADTNPSKRSTP